MTRDTAAAPGWTPTSVYIHFPWCEKRCPYCDFATRAISAEDLRHRRYADAVLRELRENGPKLEGRQLTSVFFGGGTPSLWDPLEVKRVLGAVFAAFPASLDALEVTLEANPASLTADRAKAFRDAGITRLSVGVQSLSDTELKFLGRLHDRSGALHALRAACSAVPSVSADVMFGAVERSVAAFLGDLEILLDVGVAHVSAYALSIEPGTQFGARAKRGTLRVASEQFFVDSFLAAGEFLRARGFDQYEVSNYGRRGHYSQHNTHYWRGRDYLGLGAGAVGCLSEGRGRAKRTRNVPVGEQYMEGGHPVEHEALDADTLVREAWMLALRTEAGLSTTATHERLGVDPTAGRAEAIHRNIASGNLSLHEGSYRVPTRRWLYLDGIIRDLF